jgi:hypothetical protein
MTEEFRESFDQRFGTDSLGAELSINEKVNTLFPGTLSSLPD